MSDSYILEQSYFGGRFFPNNYWIGEFFRTPTRYLVKATARTHIDALQADSIFVHRSTIDADANEIIKVKRVIIKAG